MMKLSYRRCAVAAGAAVFNPTYMISYIARCEIMCGMRAVQIQLQKNALQQIVQIPHPVRGNIIYVIDNVPHISYRLYGGCTQLQSCYKRYR